MPFLGGGGKYDVLLAGYFGFGNLGDELIAESAIQNLKRCGIHDRRIAILSSDPDYSRKRLGVDAYGRWSLSSVVSALRRSRSLVFPGGGLFQDSTSARSCVYYWGLVAIAGMLSVPAVFLGQSVGPLNGGFPRFLTRRSFLACSYAAVRDSASMRVLEEMGVRCELMPDPVMSLEMPECAGTSVLINLRRAPRTPQSAEAVSSAARSCFEEGIPMTG
ncbi:MAG: polysaccharide pyruvyl transferase family protein, partial [Synergistaceae bacterium]|nr:polysaccharide pyruvyl transferase family protein [Synergistaceae bacterium]